MKQATIVDIADKLGISPSTVSRALSGHPDVKKETKDLVQRIANELFYSPNPIARSLKSNRTSTIGVIVPEIEHDFFSSAISGIEDIASQSNYTIILCQSNESYEREIENTKLMIRHRVAGVIVSISLNTKKSDHFQELAKRNIPLVFFDRVCDDVDACKVVIDDYQSARDAVQFLIDSGRKNVFHFGGDATVGIYANRRRGYADAVKSAGQPIQEVLMENGEHYEQHGYNSMDSLIRSGTIPQAIFAVNDSVALGAFQRIKEAGLKIPTDIALIGFSNDKVTRLVDPPITTVDQPSMEMGKKAAEILIDAIEDRMTKPSSFVIPTKLIIRGST